MKWLIAADPELTAGDSCPDGDTACSVDCTPITSLRSAAVLCARCMVVA
jgi:hypothetical protein